MARIQQLPDDTANKIAAGEVVERPAAVVKELVENAIDAGARQIEIEFRHGGKSYIRVSDDGAGMGRDDAIMALQRHATSKLRDASDLLRLHTFGFRGEALPSIASVSRFTLRTRESGTEAGTEIVVDGTAKPVIRACGTPPGTTVEVARLFHTVPARRKFLKTDRTEAAHIVLLARLFAVAHPELGFTLIEDGSLRFRSPPGSRLEMRVREVFGRSLADELMPVAELEPDPAGGGVSLSGLIAKPGTGRATRAEMFSFVNRRPVDSRVLHYALVESFHTYIPKGRYPACFLFVELPPAAVDVNVHPTKREVRFRNEGGVRAVVMEALLATLRPAARGRLADARAVESMRPIVPAGGEPLRVANRQGGQEGAAAVRVGMAPPPFELPADAPESPVSPLVPANAAADRAIRTSQRDFDWRFLAFTQERLALFESRDGVVVLHLTAADERVQYETLLAQWAGEGIPVQALLFPPSMEFDPVRAEVLEQHLGFFRDLGLEVEPFGRHFYRLRSVPQAFDPESGESFLRDLVSLVAERGLRPEQTETVRERVAGMAAQRIARQHLKWDERSAGELARRLLACRQPITDPRGRPTFFEIGHREYQRRLGL